MIICGYYTNDRYKAMAEDMAKSVESFGYQCVLFKMEDAGSWTANVNLKPQAIKAAMFSAPEDSVLYLDADARMVRQPDLIPTNDYDVAAYFDGPRRPSGGCMWFHSLKRCGSLVDTWMELIKASPDAADDQVNFRDALDKHRLRVLPLPPAYNYHRPTMRSRFPKAQPVIEQYCIGAHDYKVY